MELFDDVVPHTPPPKRDRERLRAEARAKAEAGHKAHVRRQARNLAPREEDLVSWDQYAHSGSGDDEQLTFLEPATHSTPEPAAPAQVIPHLGFDEMFNPVPASESGQECTLDVETLLGPSTPRPHFGVFLAAAVLGGILGVDRFLGRRYGLGALKLLTLGGLGVWALWDIAAILCGTYTIRNSVTLAGARKHRLVASGVVGVTLLLCGALLVPQAVAAASILTTKPVVEEPRNEKVLELRSTDPKLQKLDLPITTDLTLTAMVTSSGEGSLVVTAPDRKSSFHELVDGQQTLQLEVHPGTWSFDIDCPAGCAIDVYSPPVAAP